MGIFRYIFVIGSTLVTQALHAQCSMYEVPLASRASAAQTVFEGKVLSQTCFWNDDHNFIYTAHTIEVYKIFKGTTGNTVVLITEGGIMGNEKHVLEPSLELEVGETGMFFAEASPQLNAAYTTNALRPYASAQGCIKYNLEEATAFDVFKKYSDLENEVYDFLFQTLQTTSYTEIKPFSIIASRDENHQTRDNITPTTAGKIVPTITTFAPATITAGTGSILTINGTNFQATQGTGYVEFRDADNGGATFVQPLASQYVLWTNTQIQVRVPEGAGTGTFRVVNSTGAPNTVTSATPLTVTYAQLNVISGGNAYQPDHINDNGTGGYTFRLNTGFAGNAAATAAFQRALETWRCATFINWNIGTTTATNVTASDGINIVRFDVGAELPAGVLGVCASYWNSCAANVWYVVELDVTFDSGTTWQYGPALATGAQYDFESVALHELGHGHQLGHVINAGGDVMHYAIANGANVRTLTANNIAAGNFVMGQSTVLNSCGPTQMIALTPATCPLGGPTAAFSGTPTSTCATSLTVTFTDASTGVPTAWAWDIDNNGTTDYTTQNCTHTYATPGSYTVSLTVTNALGSNTLTQTNYISVGAAGTINSIATGNWNNAATWAGGIIPGPCDHAVINNTHTVTVTAAATVGSVTIMNGGTLQTNAALTINSAFNINNGGTYRHNNTTAAATTIFNGTENFGATSTVRIDNWINANTPMATGVTGNFGHVTLNYTPTPAGAWVQNGLFSTHLILGTLTIMATQINMDNGTGNTNMLPLQDVVISGTGGMIVRTATNAPGLTIPGGVFTFTTRNITHNGSGLFNVLFETAGTLNMTTTGNILAQQDWFITRGVAGKVHVTNMTVTGNLSIAMTNPDAFDINYLAVGASHATVTVGGITTISGDPLWVRMIDRGPGGAAAASTGNLIFTTNGFNITAGLGNAFQLGDGNATIDVTTDWNITNGETSIIGEFNGAFLPVAAIGTVNATVGGSLNITGATATCNFFGIYTSAGAGNCNFTINGNYTITATNGIVEMIDGGNGNVNLNVSGNMVYQGLGWFDGIFQGNGDVFLTVGGTLDQNSGLFFGIENQLAGANPGRTVFNLGAVDFDGGGFYELYAANTAAETMVFNVAGNCDINYTAATDQFIPVRWATIGVVNNTAIFDMDVGGNLIFSGLAGTFISSIGFGVETINVVGDINCSAGTNMFNVFVNSGGTSGHLVTMDVGGSVNVSAGVLRLSSELGVLNATINGDVNVSGTGGLVFKSDDGVATVNILGGYSQTGGTTFIHEAPTAADFTADVITINVNSNNDATGNFTKTGGTLNFDNLAAAGSATHLMNIFCPTFTLGGAAANDITRTGAGTSNLYGEIHFCRGAAGTTTYNRATVNHRIQQVRQYVDAGTTVSAAATTVDLQVASNATQANITTNALVVNGTLDMGANRITGVGPSATNYFSGITVGAAGRLRTSNTFGFYDGSTNACLQPQVFAANANFRMDFNLNATSTVEYYATANQTVTGKFPNAGALGDVALATAAQYHYGNLDINHQGTLGTNFCFPAIPAAGTGNVFVRTALVLTRGELNLAGSGTGQTITIENPLAAGILRDGVTTNGYIKSEEINAGNNRAKVMWNMGTNTGVHVYPFGVTTGANNYVPFTFNKTTAGSSNIAVSTRATAAANNLPWAAVSNVAAVGNMFSSIVGGDGSVPAVIDRWWDITASAAVTANLVFTYRGVENTLGAAYQLGTLGAQHWNGTIWQPPQGTGAGVIAGTGTVSVTGANQFSPWVLSALNAVLPVELVTFTGACQDNVVKLEWTTAAESNNDYFTVERTQDGIHYELVGIVDGAGTTNTYTSYSLVDENPFNGEVFYRLTQTNFAGFQQSSPLISVFACAENDVITAWGNGEGISIASNLSSDQVLTTTLYDAGGRVILSDNLKTVQGYSVQQVNTAGVSAGVYVLVIQTGSRLVTKKIHLSAGQR